MTRHNHKCSLPKNHGTWETCRCRCGAEQNPRAAHPRWVKPEPEDDRFTPGGSPIFY